MTIRVMIDGAVLLPEEAAVSVFDRGFLYGDSVFETVRTYGGRPFALDEHLERLAGSLERVAIEAPVPLSQLRQEVLEAVAAAGNDESYIRLMVTRGTGEMGLSPELARQPMRVVIVTPLKTPPAEAYERGITAVLYRTRRSTDNTAASGAKVANYLVSVLAMKAARAEGAAEALIVNAADDIVEGGTSNVMAFRGDTLITPPVDAGILAGITRQYLLEAAGQAGTPIEFRVLNVAELPELDELIVCSSIRELLSVVRVGGVTIGEGAPGPRARALHAAFRRRVAELVREG